MAKFCGDCGSPVKEGQKFCAKCGAIVAETPEMPIQQPEPAPPVQQQYIQPQPQYQQPQYAQPQNQQQQYAQQQYQYQQQQYAPAAPKKKSSAAIIVTGALVVVLVAAGVFTRGFGLFGNKREIGGGTISPSAAPTSPPVNTPVEASPKPVSPTPVEASPTPGLNTEPQTSQKPSPTPDLKKVIGGDAKMSDNDAATRQAMIDAARAEGGDLEFRADGTVVYTDADGSVVIQHPDGSWEYRDPDGQVSTAQFGGDWPDNEFTRLLPKPSFTLSAAVTSGDMFTVVFLSAELDQLKAYTEQVKTSGFNVDADTQEMEVMGMLIYSYSAENANGYRVNIFSSAGSAGLTITKN